MKINKALFTTVLFLSFAPGLSHALDTVEPINPGLSDVQFYQMFAEPDNHATKGQIGYGVDDMTNLYFGLTYNYSPSLFILSFSDAMTLTHAKKGEVDIDIIPGIDIVDFDLIVASIAAELTYKIEEFTPYLQPRLAHTFSPSTTMFSLGIGNAWAFQKGYEFFTEIRPTFVSGNSFFGFFAGLNFEATKEFEFISEVGLTDGDFSAQLGVIIKI